MTPEARWKAAFMTLPDAAFFDILRNYLGDFKTPYNKQNLLENLRQFLLKPETRRRIVSLIDEDDARLLSAVQALDSPVPRALYRLFESELGYLDLHYRLLNLQDRLLVYTDKSSGEDRIFLTPFLEEDLRGGVINPGLLLDSFPAPRVEAPPPWISDSLLAAFFSRVLEDGALLKMDGSLKKKAAASLKEKIPVLFESALPPDGMAGENSSRALLLIQTLQTLKLLRRKETLVPDFDAWKEFAAFPPLSRLCMTAAAAACGDFLTAWKEAEWLAAFLAYLKPDRAYSRASLLRLCRLEEDKNFSSIPKNKAWLDRLLDLGIFVSCGEKNIAVNPRLPGKRFPENIAPALIVQPNFDISAAPHLPLGEALVLAAAAGLARHDVYSQYRLSKGAFARALTLGLDGETILRCFTNLAGEGLPQNVIFSLRAWEKEYESISLTEGVIIQAAENRRHLLEHSKEFSRLLRFCPAPGVYVIARSGLAACLRILRGAGVEIPPRLRSAEEITGESQGASFTASSGLVFPRAFVPVILRLPEFAEAGGESSPASTAPKAGPSKQKSPRSGVKEELLRRLRETRFPEDLESEIRERINNKLIIFPEQIGPALARGEKTEAKGLDYVGKTLVIEQALAASTEYLEAVTRKADGSPSRVLLRPKALRRLGSDLILEGEIIPGGRKTLIPVKKIGLVRRIRGSLSG